MFAPPTYDSVVGDQEPSTPGFSGKMRLTYRVGEEPVAQVTNINGSTDPLLTNVALVRTAIAGSPASGSGWVTILHNNLPKDAAGNPVFTVAATAKVRYRPIFQNGEPLVNQWQIDSGDQRYVIVDHSDRLDIYRAREIEISVLPV